MGKGKGGGEVRAGVRVRGSEGGEVRVWIVEFSSITR